MKGNYMTHSPIWRAKSLTNFNQFNQISLIHNSVTKRPRAKYKLPKCPLMCQLFNGKWKKKFFNFFIELLPLNIKSLFLLLYYLVCDFNNFLWG